ncbi:MAG: M56 family metallopeptidase [Acidobacteriota bacterium]|nr:M56 family metallopeptidase [Acidobacteriota bacterium]
MNSIVEFTIGFLLNAAWQVAAVAMAASLCSLFLRSLAARYYHALWVASLVLSVALPLWSLVGFTGTLPEEVLARPSSAVKSPTDLPAKNLAPASPAVPAPTGSGVSLGHLMKRNSQWISIASPFLLVLTIGYAIFLLYRLNRLWRAWRQAKSLLQSAYEREILAPLATVADRCRSAFDLQRVRLTYSPRARLPVTLGTRDPVIILPESFNPERSEETMVSVLGHEMAHIARRDWPLNLVYEFLWLPISFHPLANLIKRQIDRTRELACDDMVAARLLDPDVYARSLVRLAGTFVSPAGQTFTLGVFDADILEERIMKLTVNARHFGARAARLLTVSALLLLCLTGMAISTLSFNLRMRGGASAQPNASTTKEGPGKTGQAVSTDNHSAVSQQDEKGGQPMQSDQVQALNSTNQQERASAACYAGKSHQVQAIPTLVAMLGDDARIQPLRCWEGGTWNPALDTFKQPSPGEQAAIALASMGRPAFAPLTNALSDANGSVRRNSAWAIGELTNMLLDERASAVPPLISLLSDSDEWVRMAAARALGELGDDRAGESLIAALADGHDRVREIAAWALSELKDDRAVQPLCQLLLADASPEVRRTAAMALGEIRSARAVSFLTQALSDPEPRVRARVKWALTEIEDADG